MILLESKCFDTRDGLCDFVNSGGGMIEIVSIVNMSSKFVLFYRDNREENGTNTSKKD